MWSTPHIHAAPPPERVAAASGHFVLSRGRMGRISRKIRPQGVHTRWSIAPPLIQAPQPPFRHAIHRPTRCAFGPPGRPLPALYPGTPTPASPSRYHRVAPPGYAPSTPSTTHIQAHQPPPPPPTQLDAKNADLVRRSPRDLERPLRVWGFARWLERAYAHLRAQVG